VQNVWADEVDLQLLHLLQIAPASHQLGERGRSTPPPRERRGSPLEPAAFGRTCLSTFAHTNAWDG
jgi:hypothetical protein